MVTVGGHLPVTVPRPEDGHGPLARDCYEPSPRQRWLRCRRLGGDGPSSPPGLGVGRGGGVGVGPLIHTPFLLEHSFWGILGSSSDMTAGGLAFVSVVGGWVGNFLYDCVLESS